MVFGGGFRAKHRVAVMTVDRSCHNLGIALDHG